MNTELLTALETADVLTIKEHFDAMIAAKLKEELDSMKIELAKTIFNGE